MAKELYILRHCKTLFNKKNIISGQMDCPLINYDIDYYVLSEKDPSSLYVLISSPLSRCLLTGKILQEQSQLQISYHIDSRIIERNMGMLEGKNRNDLIQKYPDYFNNGHFKSYITPPMGESYHAFQSRIASFVPDIENLLLEHNVIVCAHNQSLRMFTSIISGKSYTDIPQYPNGKVIRIF